MKTKSLPSVRKNATALFASLLLLALALPACSPDDPIPPSNVAGIDDNGGSNGSGNNSNDDNGGSSGGNGSDDPAGEDNGSGGGNDDPPGDDNGGGS